MHLAALRAIGDVEYAVAGGTNNEVAAIPAQQDAIALAFGAQLQAGVGKDGAQKRRQGAAHCKSAKKQKEKRDTGHDHAQDC